MIQRSGDAIPSCGSSLPGRTAAASRRHAPQRGPRRAHSGGSESGELKWRGPSINYGGSGTGGASGASPASPGRFPAHESCTAPQAAARRRVDRRRAVRRGNAGETASQARSRQETTPRKLRSTSLRLPSAKGAGTALRDGHDGKNDPGKSYASFETTRSRQLRNKIFVLRGLSVARMTEAAFKTNTRINPNKRNTTKATAYCAKQASFKQNGRKLEKKKTYGRN